MDDAACRDMVGATGLMGVVAFGSPLPWGRGWCANDAQLVFFRLFFFASSFALPLPAGLCCVSCMHKCHVILSGE